MWRSTLSRWAALRYRGRHRSGVAVGVLAARLEPVPSDAITQIIPIAQIGVADAPTVRLTPIRLAPPRRAVTVPAWAVL